MESQWGLEWAQQTLEMANKISNFLNDSGPAKVSVQKAQLETYKRKKQIVVNVPTRFATNLFVLKSVLDSKQALLQAVSSEAWSTEGGPGGKPDSNGNKVKRIIERTHPNAEYFWENVELLVELLQPFSDAIHQIEADRPMLAQCHQVVEALAKHVQAFAQKYEDKRDGTIVLRLRETFQRRYDTVHGASRAPIYNAAYTAAYLLDPYFAVYSEEEGTGIWNVPGVSSDQQGQAVELVKRVGGPTAARQMRILILGGYPKSMAGFVEAVADESQKEAAKATAALAAEQSKSKKRKFVEMPSMNLRLKVWKQYGATEFADLTKVVEKLLTCHATTCATERNWSLWGRVYTASRSALGVERAKKMITICSNTGQRQNSDFAVSLAVVEGDV